MIPAKKTKVKIVKKGKYIQLLQRDTWEYVQRRNCSGIVIVLAVNKDNKIILTEQHRIPVNRSVIEFPAGLVNDRKTRKKETVATAAKRELLEETGYKAKRIQPLIRGPAGSGTSADVMTFVRAYDIEKIGMGGGDETENINIHEVPIEKIDRWLNNKIRKGFYVDPKIYAGLYFLKNDHKKF